MDLKINQKGEAAWLLELHRIFKRVKNNLIEVGKVADLSNDMLLGLILEKLPSDPAKTRWVKYQTSEERKRPDVPLIDLFSE